MKEGLGQRDQPDIDITIKIPSLVLTPFLNNKWWYLGAFRVESDAGFILTSFCPGGVVFLFVTPAQGKLVPSPSSLYILYVDADSKEAQSLWL